MRFARSTSLFALAGLLVFSACREAKVQSYRVPKEAPPPPLSFDMPGMASTTTGDSNGAAAASPTINAASSADAALRWDAPESWAALPPVAMRVAGYRLSTADGAASAELTITAFPGDVGGDLANINRWRGQIGLAPLAAEALASEIQQLRTAPHDRAFKLVEMANTQSSPPQATLAAYTEHEGSTWFFKLTGAPAVVASERAAFLAFLQTIQPR